MPSTLVAIIHFFHAKGWAPATSANYSFRQDDQEGFTISRSGVDKSTFSENDLMEVDADGIPTPEFEGIKPSAETLLHAMLYRVFPETKAVLHTHSVANTVFSQKLKTHAHFSGYELQKAIAGEITHEATIELPVFDNSQDMEALSREIEPYLIKNRGCRGFLLAGHGLYAWGKDLPEARRHIEAFEFLMECELRMNG